MSARRLLAGLFGVGIVALLASAGVPASIPSSSTVTVPTTAGQTVTDAWTGTIPPGGNPTSDCGGIPAVLVDEHDVTINVPAGAYDAVDATFKFTISWADAGNDEILTVLAPNGDEVASSDGGSYVEAVTASNLAPGQYKVLPVRSLQRHRSRTTASSRSRRRNTSRTRRSRRRPRKASPSQRRLRRTISATRRSP